MPQFYSQKYTVVCFIDPGHIPLSFSALDWPLHVTLLDTFSTEWTVEALTRSLTQIALSTTAFAIKPIQQAMLGPDKNVPVKLLQKDEAILGLHNSLLSLTTRGSLVFNTPEFVGQGFLPHVTDQKTGQLQIDRTYLLTSLSLVDMFPGKDHMQRKVLKTVSFKH